MKDAYYAHPILLEIPPRQDRNFPATEFDAFYRFRITGSSPRILPDDKDRGQLGGTGKTQMTRSTRWRRTPHPKSG